MPVPTTAVPARTLLRDVVHEQLSEAILTGTFEPGERLMDDEVAAWLGASRTPIREAMFQLQREGLVEIATNRFTRVAAPTASDVRAAVDHLHHLLEAARSYRFALSAEDTDVIVAGVRGIDCASERLDLELAALWDFHEPLVRASKNPVFQDAFREAHRRALFSLRARPDAISSDYVAALATALDASARSTSKPCGRESNI